MVHAEHAIHPTLRNEIAFKSGPGSHVGTAFAAMDCAAPGHIFGEGKINCVAIRTLEFAVQFFRQIRSDHLRNLRDMSVYLVLNSACVDR